MLSRKYYEEFAKILAKHGAKQDMIDEFSWYFATDNPNFDKSRFQRKIVKLKEVV